MATIIRGVVERIRASGFGTGRVRGAGTATVSLVCGTLSVLLLVTSGRLWAGTTDAADDVDRVAVFAGLPDRPLRMVNGSVDVLFVATEQVEGHARLSYAMVVHVSRRHDTTVLVDLPAGSLVHVPAHRDTTGKDVTAGRMRLSTAYAHGGPRLLVRAFEAASELRLDGYAELSLPAVAAMVDRIGGLELCVPVAVDDRAAKLRLAPGAQRFTGARAASFLRSAGGGGLARVRHNQLLFAAVTQRLFGPAAAFTLGGNRDLLRAGAGLLRVDENFDLTLARRLTLATADPYGDRVVIVGVPVAKTTKTATGTVLTWQSRLADYLFDKLRTDAELDASMVAPVPVSVAPSAVKVAVRNGTGVDGLASDASDDLDSVGFTIRGKPENADARTSRTTVYHHPKYLRQAQAVQAAVPGARLATMKTSTSTILVVVGANYSGVRQVIHAADASPDATEAVRSVTAAGPCA